MSLTSPILFALGYVGVPDFFGELLQLIKSRIGEQQRSSDTFHETQQTTTTTTQQLLQQQTTTVTELSQLEQEKERQATSYLTTGPIQPMRSLEVISRPMNGPIKSLDTITGPIKSLEKLNGPVSKTKPQLNALSVPMTITGPIESLETNCTAAIRKSDTESCQHSRLSKEELIMNELNKSSMEGNAQKDNVKEGL